VERAWPEKTQGSRLTIRNQEQILSDMFAFNMKWLSVAAVAIFLCACAVKPPVQEMAEARSAIESAQQADVKGSKATKILKSAEKSLKEAAEAIDRKHYEMARRKAVEAKRQAQLSVKMKHGFVNKQRLKN